MKSCKSALESLVGNETLKDSLLTALAAGRLCHSVLLCGEAGTGAGYAARCLAADHLYPGAPDSPRARDVVAGRPTPEVLALRGTGAAGEIRIDDVRAVRREVFNTALSAEGRAVVVYGAHRLNTSSANALLKVMEEPPPGVLFLFTAPHEAAVLPTIRSRCAVYNLAPVSEQACAAWLREHFPAAAGRAEELSALFGGKIGAAARCLEDPAAARALADARALAECARAKDGYRAMALCAGYEKDKAGAGALLELFCQLCARALRGGAAALDAPGAARAIPLAQRAAAQLRANVNARLALAVFAARLCAGPQ